VISVKVDGKDFYLIGKGAVTKLPSGLMKELHENYKEIMELIG
jgi:hypothetical protein